MLRGHGKRTLGIICVTGPRTDVLEGTLFLTWTGGGSLRGTMALKQAHIARMYWSTITSHQFF